MVARRNVIREGRDDIKYQKLFYKIHIIHNIHIDTIVCGLFCQRILNEMLENYLTY